MGGLGDTPLGSCDACSSIDVANDLMLLSALSEGTLVLDNIHKVCDCQPNADEKGCNIAHAIKGLCLIRPIKTELCVFGGSKVSVMRMRRG